MSLAASIVGLRARFRSSGGVHPAYRKDRTAGAAIRDLPLPRLLRVPLLQHLGAPAKPLVKKGESVLRGQRIADPGGFVSAAVHAPACGVVNAIEDVETASGIRTQAVVIETDARDEWAPGPGPRPDWESAEPHQLLDLVSAAGIVGMGGAGFPTHVKLAPPKDKPVHTLIVNGAECEPYLTADHRLMVEQADRIWTGARILQRILGASRLRVAVEDNKPDAVAAMQRAMAGAQGDVGLVVLKTEYPQGAEKQQIFSVTGQEVPGGGLPMDVGALVENVATAAAVWDAVVNGRPLVSRVTTVTGGPVASPGNIRAPLGTSYADLLAFCGGTTGVVGKVIAGGPMMGFAIPSLDIVTTKTASGLVFLTPAESGAFSSLPCISCGRCVDACPMRLLPCEISRMVEAEDYPGAEALCVMDCIECGCCAYVCPAHRPLVQHMKQAKARILLKRRHARTPKPAAGS